MRKTRSDALWNELTPEQLTQLDQWLFEDKLGFAEAWPKAQAELGFKGSIGSLKRYYRRRKQEKMIEDFAELQEDMAEVAGAPGDVSGLRMATMKMLAAHAFQLVREAPEDAEKWGPVLRTMVDNDRNEAIREGQKGRQELRKEDQRIKLEAQKVRQELRTEDQKIKREALAFAKEKFQINTVEAAMKVLPKLRELEQVRKDPQLRDYEQNAMVNQMRRNIFGPLGEGLPESEKEEQEMLAAMRERQAQKKREEEAWKNREKVMEPQPLTPSSPYYQEYLEWKKKKGE